MTKGQVSPMMLPRAFESLALGSQVCTPVSGHGGHKEEPWDLQTLARTPRYEGCCAVEFFTQ